MAIDAAGRAFRDRWEYGIGKIAEASEKMVEALRSTRQLYDEIDRATAEVFLAPQCAPSDDSAITRALSGSGEAGR